MARFQPFASEHGPADGRIQRSRSDGEVDNLAIGVPAADPAIHPRSMPERQEDLEHDESDDDEFEQRRPS
jgi:hypothetical protein